VRHCVRAVRPVLQIIGPQQPSIPNEKKKEVRVADSITTPSEQSLGAKRYCAKALRVSMSPQLDKDLVSSTRADPQDASIHERGLNKFCRAKKNRTSVVGYRPRFRVGRIVEEDMSR